MSSILSDNPQITLLAPADKAGCGFYRVKRPGSYYGNLDNGVAQSFGTAMPSIDYFKEKNMRMILTQRQSNEIQHRYWSSLRGAYPDMNIVIDFDDLLWQPHPGSTFKATRDYIKYLDLTTKVASHLTSSTEPLKAILEKRYKKEVRVIPNMTNIKDFLPTVARKPEEKLHFMWVGSSTHYPDLEQAIPAIIQTLGKYKWTFVGYTPEPLKGKVNSIGWLDLSNYLPRLYAVGAHVGIAPLTNCLFNECKSNVKLLEYGQLGMATIASNVYPYRNSAAVMVKKERTKDWLKAFALMEDEAFRLDNARNSVAYSESFAIQRRESEVRNAYRR